MAHVHTPRLFQDPILQRAVGSWPRSGSRLNGVLPIPYKLRAGLSPGPARSNEAMVDVFFVWYNFCGVHQTLRMSPAMEAGWTDHVWTVRKLLTA